MAEPHLDHPGEVSWFPGKGPAQVLGACPHRACPHNTLAAIAWGPDFEHYTLDECRVPADLGGCGGTCRSWSSEVPRPRGGIRYGWGPYLHVQQETAPAIAAPPAEIPGELVAVGLGEEFVAAVEARAGELPADLRDGSEHPDQDEAVFHLGRTVAITATLEELLDRGWLIAAPTEESARG